MNIPLTKGQVTLIDDVDADLSNLNWYASFNPTYGDGGAYIAVRRENWVNGKRPTTVLHRVILGRILNRLLSSNEQVDHINRNPLDNRRENLRIATGSQNSSNQSKRKKCTSDYKGVSWYKRIGKWNSRITVEGKHVFLGYYGEEIEAAKAYDKAAKELHKEFAVLNFPDRN